MVTDGTIPLLNCCTRILNEIEGRKKTFSLAKDSGLSLRFLSHTRQSEKMLSLKVRRKFSTGAEQECLQQDVLIVYPTCVPGVVAGRPGQIPGETVGQVEDGPG